MHPVVRFIGGAEQGGAHQARSDRGDRMADVELTRQLLQREGRLLFDRY